MTRLSSLSGNKAGVLYGLGAFGVFATHDLFIKQLGGVYSPFQILFFGALLSFPIITIVLIGDEKPGTLRPRHPWWLALRSVSGALTAIAAFYAFTTLPLSQVYAILFSAPLMITLLAIPMLGETVGLRRWFAVLLGLVGVMVVVQPGRADFELGHAAAFFAAFAGALNSVVVRKIGNEERGVVMVLYPMMTNLLISALVLPFVYVEVAIADLGFMAIVAALGLLGMGMLVLAYSRGDAIIVAPTQYSQILWAAAYGALLFGEYPDRNTYIGTAIIILSGVYILKREATGKTSTQTPVLKTRSRTGVGSALRVGMILRRKKRQDDNK